MNRLGTIFALIGLGVLVSYGSFHILKSLLFGLNPPLIIRLAILATILGTAILFASVVRDKLKKSNNENFEETDY